MNDMSPIHLMYDVVFLYLAGRSRNVSFPLSALPAHRQYIVVTRDKDVARGEGRNDVIKLVL